jgi:transcriptional regulator with XRE-family HTH domain
MTLAQDFHSRLRALRATRNLTQQELADKIGAAQSTIGDWEKGPSSPPVDKLAQLCQVFNVSADYLAGLSDHPYGLPPDSFLVDVGLTERIQEAQHLDDLAADLLPLATRLLWNMQVPRKARLVTMREFMAQYSGIDAKVLRLQRGGTKR